MNKSQILHIAPDEKFINGAYRLFEKAFPGCNKFVIVKPSANPPIRYLDGELLKAAYFEIKSTGIVDRLKEISDRHSVTVLHGVNNINGSVFQRSVKKDRFMAVIFGAEVYNSGILNNELMGPKSRKLYELTQRKNFIDALKDLYRAFKYRHVDYPDEINIKEVLYSIDVFGALPGRSSEMLSQNLFNPTVQKVPFTYYPIDFIIKDEEMRSSGPDIFLGNSASATNNHLEAFDLLKKFDLEDRNIVTPLSYGSKKYAKEIINEGLNIFNNRFKPLTSFVPIEEYNKIISSCGIVIMNHYRPQAMGNIIASLYLGAKVFLNDTEIYRYFNQLGCHIYLIDKDLKSQEAFNLLTEEQVKDNQEILKNNLSASVLAKELRESFRDIFDFDVIGKEREVVLWSK